MHFLQPTTVIFGDSRVAGIVEAGNPGGTDKKLSAFAMLGRTYGLKIFGPYRHNKYNFLDAVSIQTDDDGFYAVNPTNSVEHWVVPMNHTQGCTVVEEIVVVVKRWNSF